MGVLYKIQCREEGCDRIFREMHGMQELLQTQPPSDEYACTGWLAQQTFLNGWYVGGAFGGDLLFEGDKDEAEAKRAEHPDFNHTHSSYIKTGLKGGAYRLIHVPEELKEDRLDALEKGIVEGITLHADVREINGSDNSFGPRYCEEHAFARKLICQECDNELVRASGSFGYCSIITEKDGGQIFDKLKMMNDQDFMRTFFPHIIGNPDMI